MKHRKDSSAIPGVCVIPPYSEYIPRRHCIPHLLIALPNKHFQFGTGKAASLCELAAGDSALLFLILYSKSWDTLMKYT